LYLNLHVSASKLCAPEKIPRTQQNPKFILDYTKGKELILNKKGKKIRTVEKIEFNQHM